MNGNPNTYIIHLNLNKMLKLIKRKAKNINKKNTFF